MSGIQWVSYRSDTTLDAGYNSVNQLYNNSITFFNSPPAPIASGTLTTLQINSGSSGNDHPPYSTFTLDPNNTTNIAIKFSGYFCPNQTGNWTLHLGNGETNPCDDFAILFLGVPNATITPNATFTSESNVPSRTLPLMRNVYNSGSNSKTVALVAGNYYPILIYYNQGRYGYTCGLSFSINGGSLITDFTNYTSTTVPPPITCFNKGTKILTDKGYILIEDLRKGVLIKTLNDGYKSIEMIGKREILHKAIPSRIKDQLYKCCRNEYPEIFEDLIITGCHSILVDDFKNDEMEKTADLLTQIYITDGKYRLPACIDERASVYEKPGTYTIYHLALEHDDYYMNYGIYANGLMVETCSRRYLKEISNMMLIE